MTTSNRLLPVPTPETAAFWNAAKQGTLLLQHCPRCVRPYFPPRPFCPVCGSQEVIAIPACGEATLWSYVISMRPAPGMEAPYVVAVVKLREGVTMMSNIVNCRPVPEDLRLDMPLRVRFVRQTEDITLPMFEPAEAVR
jgi:uncharacterized OB-fold protein